MRCGKLTPVLLRIVPLLSSLAGITVAAAAEDPPSPGVTRIEVVDTAPMAGAALSPGAVQAASASRMLQQQPLNLPEFMSRSLAGVHITDTQSNPYQPDVLYRGFNASSALGAAQGLSVYFDGVRINEPFGDVVNWDLIPQAAIADITLVPGANPLFGLNTLGGALSVRSKSGAAFPGTRAQAYAGSFARRAAEVETGGSDDTIDHYLAAHAFREDGWRDFSPSEVKQLLAKAGWTRDDAHLDFTVVLADTSLNGNGSTPSQLLAERREAIYTHPDNTRNRLGFAIFKGHRKLAGVRFASANAYYRWLDTRTFNGDVNEVEDPRFGVLPYEEGPDDLDGGGPGLGTDAAAINRSRSLQRGHGLNVQWSAHDELAARPNVFTVGAGYDQGETDFRQSYQLGTFTPDRGVDATGAEVVNVSIAGSSRTASAYFSDRWSIFPGAHLMLSGRHNHTRVKTVDRIEVPFPSPALGLDNDFTYSRFNPALGLTVAPTQRLMLFAGYGQGNRAPSPIELGCSDPESPCRLPNAMASDPFLKDVVARTLEGGARGKLGADTDWNVALFRTGNRDDIVFVSVSAGGAGFFQNFGRTRRQGLEAGLAGSSGRLQWSANYSYLEATFESEGVLLSENNSARDAFTPDADDDDQILVRPGNRMPGVPRHNFKLSLAYDVGTAWTLGGNLVALSSQLARGNENNLHEAGTFTNSQGNTRTFVGSGKVPGYAVLNLNLRYRVARHWQIFARLDNVFDRNYPTAAVLGENAFPDGNFSPDSGTWRKDTFYAPGAPRAAWIGIRFEQ